MINKECINTECSNYNKLDKEDVNCMKYHSDEITKCCTYITKSEPKTEALKFVRINKQTIDSEMKKFSSLVAEINSINNRITEAERQLKNLVEYQKIMDEKLQKLNGEPK